MKRQVFFFITVAVAAFGLLDALPSPENTQPIAPGEPYAKENLFAKLFQAVFSILQRAVEVVVNTLRSLLPEISVPV